VKVRCPAVRHMQISTWEVTFLCTSTRHPWHLPPRHMHVRRVQVSECGALIYRAPHELQLTKSALPDGAAAAARSRRPRARREKSNTTDHCPSGAPKRSVGLRTRAARVHRVPRNMLELLQRLVNILTSPGGPCSKKCSLQWSLLRPWHSRALPGPIPWDTRGLQPRTWVI
jgi:hypothetical protein